MRELDRDIDKQYSPSAWVKRCAPKDAVRLHIQFCEEETKKSVKNLHSLQGLKLTDDCAEEEFINIFFATEEQKLLFEQGKFSGNIIAFIHGGYWSKGVLENVGAYFAQQFVGANKSNTAVATIEYKLSPPNKISSIYQSVLEIVAKMSLKSPKADIYIVGHSAGAHLAALILDEVVSNISPALANLKGLLLVSGIYDLDPIKRCCINQESSLNLSDEEVQKFSPILRKYSRLKPGTSQCKVRIIVGEHDSPEFQRQSKQFFEKLVQPGIPAVLEVAQGEDHFSIMESFAKEQSFCHCKLRNLLNL